MNRALWIFLAGVLVIGTAQAATLPPVVRGDQALMLRAEAGPLQLKLYKRDLNIYDNPDPLKAVLYDPQRRLVATLEIPDDGLPKGKPGQELQSAEATVPNAVAGVYQLRVTTSGDSVFGLQTNAPGCMLQGEIALNDGSMSGRLVFAPPAEKFTLKAQAFHSPGEQQMRLLDDKGQVLNTFDIRKQGVDQVFEVAAGERAGRWQFAIDKMDVKIVPSKPLWWTLDPSAWFEVTRTRWMLLPYRQARYLQPGQSARVTFDLRNTTGAAAEFALSVAGESGLQAKVEGPQTVELTAGERREIAVTVAVVPAAKAATRQLALTATSVDDPTVATSAGVEVRRGVAPVGQSLTLPIALKPYEHENWQFGYAPEYAPNEVHCDRDNRPYLRQRGDDIYTCKGLQVLEDGQWVMRPFAEAIQKVFPAYRGSAYGAGGFLGAKVAFDGENGAYTLLRLGLDKSRQSALVYTPDAGKSYQAYPVPGTEFDIEQFTGHNALSIPPPILCYSFVKPHPAEFAGYYDLSLLLPRKVNGKLVLGEPVKIAENCLGSCQHSGGPASTATRDGKTYIVWGEIAPDDAPGVPEYVTAYDHATGQVSPKVLLGHGPPVNDVHNVPAICLDSKGFIHVVVGSHGQAFQYARSVRPNDASEWTKPVPVLSAGYVDEKTDADGEGRQTYISLVCDQKDTLHIAFRQWRRNVDDWHRGQIYAALSVQSKPAGQEWGPAQPIVAPVSPGYSIYYHKLTADRTGRLYLSYSYWTSDTTYQSDYPDRYHNRAVVTPEDGGQRWKLLETSDFARKTQRQ